MQRLSRPDVSVVATFNKEIKNMLSSFFKFFYKMCVVVFSARKGNPIHLTLISVRRKTLPSMQYNSWILFYKIKKLKGKKTWS